AAAGLLRTWASGDCPVPLDLRLDAGALGERLALVPLDRVLVTDETRPAVAAALRAIGLPHSRPRLVTVSSDPAAWDPPAAGRFDGSDGGLVVFTSGTTGRSRAVLLTRANLLACATEVVRAHALEARDRVLSPLPLAHVNAPVISLLATVLSGGDVVLLPRFEPRLFWRVAVTEGATWANLVPPLLSLLDGRRDAARPTSLRFLRSASAPLTPALMEAVEGAFGVPVVESYGISEASSQVTANDVPPGPRRPGWVGTPRGVEVRVVGPEGAALAPDEVGEVVVRGPTVMRGYLGDPEATSAALRGGWLHTGDLGALSEEGALRIAGRSKELINRGGEKIAPRLVEDVLLAHPAVLDAAVVGVPDPVYGEEIKALVVPAGERGSVPADVQRYAAAQLAVHARPRLWEAVDQIPRNAAGKVWRAHLWSREQSPPSGHPEPPT
ncbi:MAG: AMP-binding protein, partial [Candidatus Dormibacteraeota bacterium]|nr:AMP-binding protein [Candidatus Dormibacteraeota bacterium]MBO0761544.1 AMP-binding protein [Candidatus Dormibacteraeota bacterium]